MKCKFVLISNVQRRVVNCNCIKQYNGCSLELWLDDMQKSVGTYVTIAYIYEVCIVAIYLAGPLKMAACHLKRRTAI